MKNPKAKESFATLAQRLREIRKRPIPPERVKALNELFDQIQRAQEREQPEDFEEKKDSNPSEMGI